MTFLSDNEDQPTRSGIYSETSKSLQECSYYESHKERKHPPNTSLPLLALPKPSSPLQLMDTTCARRLWSSSSSPTCTSATRTGCVPTTCAAVTDGKADRSATHPAAANVRHHPCFFHHSPLRIARWSDHLICDLVFPVHHGGQCGHYTDHSPNNCHGKVASNPDDCKLLSTWAATNCRYSCCIAWITTPAPPPTAAPTPAPTWRPRNPDPDCARLYSNKRAVDQCGRWLSSAVGKRNCGFPDTFEARHCQQLCCELGTRVPATPPPYVPPVITQPVTTRTSHRHSSL